MANVKISELVAAGDITGAEQLPVVQDSATKRTTVAALIAPHEADTTNVHGIANTANLATQDDITAAVTALIGGAPGALDTLNELAAAINDDASFAATVTAALADRATVDALAAHAADTSSVHGVDDMEALLDALAHAATDHTGIPGVGTEGIDAAVAAHSADTTSVHGIIDTAALATDTEVTAAIAAAALVADNVQTGNYTYVLSDLGKNVRMNMAGAGTLTIPPNSSVACPVGAVLAGCQWGAGQITVTPGSGVTLRSSGGKLKTSAQYACFTALQIATNEWLISGDLSV